MSLTSDTGEVEELIMRASPSAGVTATVQEDATEDREILGYELVPGTVGLSDTVVSEAEAFVGVNPNVADGNVHRLGGKFYARGELMNEYNATDTIGRVHASEDGHPIEGQAAWDWNEDVTLTFEVFNSNASTGQSPWYLIIYYREA